VSIYKRMAGAWENGDDATHHTVSRWCWTACPLTASVHRSGLVLLRGERRSTAREPHAGEGIQKDGVCACVCVGQVGDREGRSV
jgi:hypothetical protein